MPSERDSSPSVGAQLACALARSATPAACRSTHEDPELALRATGAGKLRPYTAGVALAVFFGLSLTGCGLMKRADVQIYTLASLPAGGAAGASSPAAAPARAPLAIGAIELPPGLERREIVVRGDDLSLDVRGTELWSAPLDTLVLHALAVDLAERVPEGGMVLPGQLPPAAGVRSLDLVFAELGAGPEAELVVDVRWTLRTGVATAAPLAAGRERLVEPLDSLASASIAAGTSRALAALADRLVAAAAAAPVTPASPGG
jgi:uncharacterized lipoprotein YmbA